MTLEDVRTLKKDTLTPAIVADVLDCDPQYIRIAARQCPERLGFPVARIPPPCLYSLDGGGERGTGLERRTWNEPSTRDQATP